VLEEFRVKTMSLSLLMSLTNRDWPGLRRKVMDLVAMVREISTIEFLVEVDAAGSYVT